MSHGNGENDDQLVGFVGENPGKKHLASVSLNNDGAPWDGELHTFAVNAPNTRIATVITINDFIRKQQVWDGGSGDLLWTNQDEFCRETLAVVFLKIPPRFCPDGDYVAFYLNKFEVIVVSVTKASAVSKRINLTTLSIPTEINFDRDFALGPKAESLAVVTIEDNRFTFRIPTEQLFIDLVACPEKSFVKGLYYSKDGKFLFCAIHQMLKRLQVVTYNLKTLQSYPFCEDLNDVSSVTFSQLLKLDDCNAIIFQVIRSPTKLKTFGRKEEGSEIRWFLDNGAVGSFQADGIHSDLIVSEGSLMSVRKLEGRIISWSPSMKRAAPFRMFVEIASFEKLHADISWNLQALAFNNGRITFLSKTEGKFIFINTEPVLKRRIWTDQ